MSTLRSLQALACTTLLCLAPTSAFADQYAYVTVQQAVAALEALGQDQPIIQSYCAPCGDRRAQAVAVHEIGIERVWDEGSGAKVYMASDGRSFWKVVVNGDYVDLAYVYVRNGQAWENLAMRIGLQPSEVPRALTPQQVDD